ncbi:8768_t:CDS:2 [Scutellospora calospora]|uniref:8768_t:CDS:1 n=1 Tax=Scutellospora calospora TaxID=85575 RepID=A0ACA9JYQ1_9GLOM|nr:8768_t:CDS:2 [Scutellospora calospora]
MCNVFRSARHIFGIDAFLHVSKTVKILYDLSSRVEAIRIGYEFLRQGKHVAFVSTEEVMTRVLVEKASKLFKPNNLPIRASYTNTVEAGISFEVTGYFNIVIAIINIATSVHIEALAQILYQIHDCPHLNESPAIITFIEVEYQKHLFARYFIEKLCSLIAIEALVIKETDFNAVATSWNLGSEEAENLKFDQECSIPDTMALKCFYIQNIYGCKNINTEDWDNLCNKKFVEHFSLPKLRKYFLRLSHFQKQGCNKDSAIEGLVAKDFAQ